MVPALICGGEGLLPSFPQQNSANKKHIQWILTLLFRNLFPHWIHIGKILSVCFWIFCESYLEHEASSKKDKFFSMIWNHPQRSNHFIGCFCRLQVVRWALSIQLSSSEAFACGRCHVSERSRWTARESIQSEEGYITRWLHRSEHLVGNKLASLCFTMFHLCFFPHICVHFELVSVFHDRFTPTSSFRTLTVVHADATSFPLGEERVGCPGRGKPQVTRWGRRVS